MDYVDNDVVKVWLTGEEGAAASQVVVLYRGDELAVIERSTNSTRVRLSGGREGVVRGWLKTRRSGLLSVAFVDVGQGDGCVITTADGKRVLVDGGENQQFARYIAARYRTEFEETGQVSFDAIVVTHGDADHFDGLSTLVLDADAEQRPGKRIRIAARRVFHNGLVKRGGGVREDARLGPPQQLQGRRVVPVVNDPRTVPDANRPFRRWQRALDALTERGPTDIRRIDDRTLNPFSFLGDVKVTVLGPCIEHLPDGTATLPHD